MPSSGDEIDRLYQLPLDEFTSARNALAKQSAAGAEIKALQKPSVPAWAVNQLYWQRRKAYDHLMAAAEKRRDAHARRLTGKASDVDAAEAAHAVALKKAAEEIRTLLSAAGDSATPATMIAVNDTLQGLPGDEPAGRLTRPLKPKGFEALAGLVSFAKALPPIAKPSIKSQPTKPDKRAEEAKQRQLDEIAEALREARTAEREASTALARSRDARDRVEQERAELTQRLDGLAARSRKLTDDIHRQEREAAKATSERERLELQLGAAKSENIT